ERGVRAGFRRRADRPRQGGRDPDRDRRGPLSRRRRADRRAHDRAGPAAARLLSLAVLDRLASCHEALIRALDGNDLGAIEGATLSLADAVASARAQEDWASGPEIRERLLSL